MRTQMLILRSSQQNAGKLLLASGGTEGDSPSWQPAQPRHLKKCSLESGPKLSVMPQKGQRDMHMYVYSAITPQRELPEHSVAP